MIREHVPHDAKQGKAPLASHACIHKLIVRVLYRRLAQSQAKCPRDRERERKNFVAHYITYRTEPRGVMRRTQYSSTRTQLGLLTGAMISRRASVTSSRRRHHHHYSKLILSSFVVQYYNRIDQSSAREKRFVTSELRTQNWGRSI
jgi:hypothetical protein